MTSSILRMTVVIVVAFLFLTVANSTEVQAQTESRSVTQMSAEEVARLVPGDPRVFDSEIDNSRVCGTDQSSLVDTTCVARFVQYGLAQSFIPSEPFSCGGMVVLRPSFGSPGTVTIELWDGLPNAGGTMMASGADPAAAPGGVASVTWPPVSVTPGNTYYLLFTADVAGEGMCIGGDLNNPYPFGNVFANPAYNPYATFDFAFEAFGDSVPVELQRFEVE